MHDRETIPEPRPVRVRQYTMRSVLEGRWSRVLDALGVRWEYEPRAWYLEAGTYVPGAGVPGMITRETHYQGGHNDRAPIQSRWQQPSVGSRTPPAADAQRGRQGYG